MRIALLGCGYVANMYRLSLPLHPELSCAGVFDLDPQRAKAMGESVNARAYETFAQLLEDENVDLVLNLTNPGVHYETTKACLEAGKHVYTEKPLAMALDQAKELVDIAQAKGLSLSSAPCTLMSQAAQTLWKTIRDQAVGRVRLVYAEMEDGMVHKMPVQRWVNEMGVPWPYEDEFKTGCTIEHAGYVLSWLAAFFGPAESVSAFSDSLIDEKAPGIQTPGVADFSVGCVRFKSGVVARLTCGIYAPHDHALRVFGDEGEITLHDPRCDDSKISLRRYITFRRGRRLNPLRRKVKLLGTKAKYGKYKGSQRRDFLSSVSEMAQAIGAGREPYLAAPFCLHVNEMVLAIHQAMETAMPYAMTTSFDPPKPLPWAT